LAALLALALSLNRPAVPSRLMGDIRVIDGDSLWVGGREVRLAGIDAPELHQTCEREGRAYPCGRIARAILKRKLRHSDVMCETSKNDRYGRALGTCKAGGEDINADMVRDGLAVAYGAYRDEENEARLARRGLWSGTFQVPSDWRRAHPRPD
jgi:endonuclease YncB( thermonuclease family)